MSLAGFSEADIAEIEKALPAVARLLASATQFEPLITKSYPDLVAVLPAAKIIVAYAQSA